jgi:hypothetical protein
LITPRTRGKQLVKPRTRFDRVNNETLSASAHFLGGIDRICPEPGDRHRARAGQGVRPVARGAPRDPSCLAPTTTFAGRPAWPGGRRRLNRRPATFWRQAYTDLLKFVILLRRISDGYTTFSEVYRYILDDAQIA